MWYASIFNCANILLPEIVFWVLEFLFHLLFLFRRTHDTCNAICPRINSYKLEKSYYCFKIITWSTHHIESPFCLAFITVFIIESACSMELTILEKSNILLPIMHVIFGESERAITVELIIKQFA